MRIIRLSANAERNRVLSVFFGVAIVLFLVLKGTWGNGFDQANALTSPGQVFESSIARGRYALILSIVESGSFEFSKSLAAFAAPDVSMIGKKFVSIFPPGVALALTPFYAIGRMLGFGQLAAVGVISVIAFINTWLLYRLALKFGFSVWSSLLAAIAFIFGTNALAYSTVISQHHFTVLLLVCALHLLWEKRLIRRHAGFWTIYGLSILIDWPNLVILAPVAVYLLVQDIVMKRRFGLALVIPALGAIPVGLYGLYNSIVHKNPFAISQLSHRVEKVSDRGFVLGNLLKSQLLSTFYVRHIPNGLKVLLISGERGAMLYSPISLLALFGIPAMFRKDKAKTCMLLVIPVLIVLMYSMFGDVWGGSSFGPRYLIPAFAVLSLFVASGFESFKRNKVFLALFGVLLSLSIAINVVGAITTISIPGGRETKVLGLAPVIEIVMQVLNSAKLGSFVYNIIGYNILTGSSYLLFVFSTAMLTAAVVFWYASRLK